MALRDMLRRRFLMLPLMLFLPGFAQAQEMDAVVGRLMATPASQLDTSLSPGVFEPWLRGVLPRETVLTFELNDCGEHAGDPEADRGRGFSACLAVGAEIVSRSRALQLLFDQENLASRGGSIFSSELEGVLDVRALSDLPALLGRPMRPFPLRCPSGTARKLKEEYAGLFEWCEDTQGNKQGPYRSWFNTGLYLLERGGYKDDRKVGQWIECNRFEVCVSKSYPDHTAP